MADPGERKIYLLSPRTLSPETIAVAFAKTSRSPLSFKEIAEELTDHQSAEFHEKWVVGYGHASVAEHAVLHIAMENISRLAIECVESNRLASYTEKSTRYQKWEAGSYIVPPEVLGTPHEDLFRRTCDMLLQTYQDSLQPVREVIRSSHSPKDDESETSWDGRIRSRYIDACRFLLPAAVCANVGMTANARVLENAIRKMLSHRLAEVRQIGEELKGVGLAEAPTLIKYADAIPYLEQSAEALSSQANTLPIDHGRATLDLAAWDAHAEQRVLAAALYQHQQSSFSQALHYVEQLDPRQLQDLADSLLGGMQRFDVPQRVLEHAVYTFDARMDQGAYFEVKRHRMMSQTPQPLSARLGYQVPRLICQAGFEARYRAAMQAAAAAYEQLAGWNADAAAYLVPNGFNRRLLMTLNLRDAYHFCELRSAPNAHFSVRRLALQMAEKIRQVHPRLGAAMRLPADLTWQQVSAEHFCEEGGGSIGEG